MFWLGPLEYKSKKELLDRLKDYLQTPPIGVITTKLAVKKLHLLIGMHPEASRKIGVGIDHFKIVRNALGEEKHVHARGALEHYRQSVKEQRDQDQRRHESQLHEAQEEKRKLQETLVLKQDDLTRLNRDNEAHNIEGLLYASADSLERELALARCQRFNNLNVVSLATQFGVSDSAMALRLKELGLVRWP